MRVGGNTFACPLVSFNEAFDGAHFGAQILGRMVMTIDQKNRRIRFMPGLPAPEPVKLATGVLAEYGGRFGVRTITAKDGELYLKRDGGPQLKLVAAAKDEFTLEQIAGARIRFTRDTAGKVAALEVLTPTGAWEKTPRDAR